MFLEILFGLFLAAYFYYKWVFGYWRRYGLVYLEPKIPFGNSANPFTRKEHFGVRVKRLYDEIKSKGWKHAGIYMILRPTYLVVDLDYIKNIMAKDFQYFVDRRVFYNEKHDPLSAHLFAIGGQKWRTLRTKLTPTFTSGKMKMMFQTLLDCVPNLLNKIESDRIEDVPIDIKEALGCFTTDIIGSCAFGLDCNTFKSEESEFRKYGKKFFAASSWRIMLMIFASTCTTLAKFLGVCMTPPDVSKFFIQVVKDTVKYREENNIRRNDFLQLLIDMKNGNKEETLTIEEVAAQCFVFFLAGFETSSTTMTFALYELSKSPHIQEKLHNEINTVLENHKGEITYEAIQEMKYMDQVINETLRKYPPVSNLTRQCVQDYKLPDDDVVIKKGTGVLIPVYAIHHDEQYYPDPEKFDPDRFTEENKAKRHNFAHIPFGEGPRLCIGMRFGLMQSKVGLAALLKKYKFSVNKKTQEPLKMQVNSFVLAAEGDIWLNAKKIE